MDRGGRGGKDEALGQTCHHLEPTISLGSASLESSQERPWHPGPRRHDGPGNDPGPVWDAAVRERLYRQACSQ